MALGVRQHLLGGLPESLEVFFRGRVIFLPLRVAVVIVFRPLLLVDPLVPFSGARRCGLWVVPAPAGGAALCIPGPRGWLDLHEPLFVGGPLARLRQ